MDYIRVKNGMIYLHDYDHWWEFRYDSARLLSLLGSVRAKQGKVLGGMSAMGFSIREEAQLQTLSSELVHSWSIEGEKLDMMEVRSSIARRLGMEVAGLPPSTRYVEGVVEMLLDATHHYADPLTEARLFGWHNTLFPTGMSGLYRIEVGKYRTGEMQVVSGAMGHERVHYQAPSPDRIPDEMRRFLDWVNAPARTDPVLKSAIAHLWFVTIHPFDDGNGRITRAITDMLLARAEDNPHRFYSMSMVIKQRQREYYDVLERTQRGDGDITEWLTWFLLTLDKALDAVEGTCSRVRQKSLFWERHRDKVFNERQRKLINLLQEDFYGKLTTGKWAKIAKCSPDTALNDIKDLVAKGILVKGEGGGRSTHYLLAEQS